MFKRVCLLFITILTFLIMTFLNFDYLFLDVSKNFTFYKGQKGSLSKEVLGGCNFLGVLGQATIVNEEQAKKVFNSFNAKVVFTEEIDGIKNYYCYSNKIKYGVTLKEKGVNLHFSINKGKITLGSPLIFGSY